MSGECTVAQNFSPRHRPRRQDWRGELCENGMFYITKTELIKKGVLQGGRWDGTIDFPWEHWTCYWLTVFYFQVKTDLKKGGEGVQMFHVNMLLLWLFLLLLLPLSFLLLHYVDYLFIFSFIIYYFTIWWWVLTQYCKQQKKLGLMSALYLSTL